MSPMLGGRAKRSAGGSYEPLMKESSEPVERSPHIVEQVVAPLDADRQPHDRVRDPQDLRQPGLGIGRDRSRTPMPWDTSPFAGFSTTEPWLPLNMDWPTRNVAVQEGDPRSMLHLYRRLLALRRAHPALALGAFEMLDAPAGALAYARSHEGSRLVVLLNLTSRNVTIDWQGTPLLSTLDSDPEPGMLYPDEALVIT